MNAGGSLGGCDPNARREFADLPEFPWTPTYRAWRSLRLAHVDEGPKAAPVALLIHGEPAWSYLYRTMIPPLLAADYRCIAPDLPGFGRSAKPTDEDWYELRAHVDAIAGLIADEDLRRITLFCQDWGGPIGLRRVTMSPDRFERLVITNTWLHHDGFVTARRFANGARSPPLATAWAATCRPGGLCPARGAAHPPTQKRWCAHTMRRSPGSRPRRASGVSHT